MVKPVESSYYSLSVMELCVWLQQTKAKYEIEAEKRELARLLEKRTQEVENLTGQLFMTHTETEDTELDKLYL